MSVVSCKEQDASAFRSKGLGLNDQNVFVSGTTLDSVLYASGEQLWFLTGELEYRGAVEPFRLIFDRNPLLGEEHPIQSKAPFSLKEPCECVFTRDNGFMRITWRNTQQQLTLKTSITSGH